MKDLFAGSTHAGRIEVLKFLQRNSISESESNEVGLIMRRIDKDNDFVISMDDLAGEL